MGTYTIISDPNHTVNFRVHVKGCRDIERTRKSPGFSMAGNTWDIEAESGEDAARQELKALHDNDQGYSMDDFHICGCCKRPEPKTIDITPTWTGILPTIVALLESGKHEARAEAMKELRRMAEAADRHNELAAKL